MTLLSRKADYALLILSALAAEGGGNARAIAERFGLSRAFVANILKELCQKGFVTSHRGVKGGYALLRAPASVSLAELLESIEDGFQLTVCNPAAHPGDGCAIAGACTVKGAIAEVHGRLLDVLRGVTLADIFDPTRARPAARPSLPVLTAGCGSSATA
jgi:Rrf2 family protein